MFFPYYEDKKKWTNLFLPHFQVIIFHFLSFSLSLSFFLYNSVLFGRLSEDFRPGRQPLRIAFLR